MAELDDEQLVALAVQGDSQGAEQLYRRHAAFAFNLAARIAGSTHDVEDVVHDAFIKAFDSLGSLRNPKAFKSWLGSIVVHAMRSRLRRGRLMRVLGLRRNADPVDLDCLASDGVSPRARAELAQVYALLRTLPADDRIAWTLRYVEGHDLKQAAELADCSLATVKRRIRRAQQYIEEHYVGTQDDDEEQASQDEAPASQRAPKRSKGAAS
jgi:RNA polymerase sigma-70 factor (ECF subfamily)